MKLALTILLTSALGAQVPMGGSIVPTSGTIGGLASLTTCKLGQQYFATDAAAGQNFYMSTTGGTGTCVWTQQGGSGGGLSNGMNLVRTSSTVLTALGTCSPTSTCNVGLGGSPLLFSASSTATLSAGTGAARLYVDASGVLTIGHNLTLNCSAGCTAVGGISAFPPGSTPLYLWPATSGTWDTTGSIDYRAYISYPNIQASAGGLVTPTGNVIFVGPDPAVVPMFLIASTAINFGSISAGACPENTLTLTGAAVNDGVMAAWPTAIDAHLTRTMRVSATNTITVTLCNFTGSPIVLGSLTFGATIVRHM